MVVLYKKMLIMPLGWKLVQPSGCDMLYIEILWKTFLKILNYKANSLDIWHKAESSGPLHRLFKLCLWGKNLPSPRRHMFHVTLQVSDVHVGPHDPLVSVWVYFRQICSSPKSVKIKTMKSKMSALHTPCILPRTLKYVTGLQNWMSF